MNKLTAWVSIAPLMIGFFLMYPINWLIERCFGPDHVPQSPSWLERLFPSLLKVKAGTGLEDRLAYQQKVKDQNEQR